MPSLSRGSPGEAVVGITAPTIALPSRRGFLLGMLKLGAAAAIIPAASLMRGRGVAFPVEYEFEPLADYDLVTPAKSLFPRRDELSIEDVEKALLEIWSPKNRITPDRIFVHGSWIERPRHFSYDCAGRVVCR